MFFNKGTGTRAGRDCYTWTMSELQHSEIDLALGQHRIGINASELHGSLCGYLCAGGAAGTHAWCEALALEALQDLIADDAQARQTFAQFFDQSRARLIDPLLAFEPMLPDDDVALSQRAAALVEWCRGFVGGLGLAGNDGAGTLSDEGQEILNDLSRIAASDLVTGESDDDEADFTEVLEYVRVGVMLLLSELTAVAPGTTRH
jgi:uncharacterized protein YgfB (UPF0149 family)